MNQEEAIEILRAIQPGALRRTELEPIRKPQDPTTPQRPKLPVWSQQPQQNRRSDSGPTVTARAFVIEDGTATAASVVFEGRVVT